MDKETQLVHQILAKRDFQWRMENHLWIRDMDGSERPISKLKQGQVKLLNLIDYCKKNDFPLLFLILKDRKVGVSTFLQMLAFLEIIDNDSQVLTVAHDKASASYIASMNDCFYRHYPLEKPKLRFRNSRGIGIGISGGMEIHTANKTESTRSRTPQMIVGDEAAWWVYGNKASIAINNTLGTSKRIMLFYPTTANGYDPFFQPLWENAYEHCIVTFDKDLKPSIEIRNKENWFRYIPLFLSSIENEDKRSKIDSDEERQVLLDTLNQREVKVVKEQGAPLEYIKYRRERIPLCGGIDNYNQEHPETPDVAFITTGNPRFDQTGLAGMQKEEGSKGILYRDNEGFVPTVFFKKESFGDFIIYRKPVVGHRYVMGIDMSTGKKDDKGNPDDTVVDLYDLDAGAYIEQVAVFAGRFSSEETAEPVLLLGEYFQWPYIVSERSYADYLITFLSRNYPMRLLYKGPDHKIGYHTHSGSRNRIIDELALAISKREIMFHNEKTIDQCRAMVKEAGKPVAGRGQHDDYVFAAGFAVIGAGLYPNVRAIQPRRASWESQQQQLIHMRTKRPLWDGYDEAV